MKSKMADKGSTRESGGQVVLRGETFQGPIPPPAVLDGYERVVKGAAERIIAMAEREQVHRHEMEMSRQKNLLGISRTGQYLGFILVLVFAVVSVLAIYLGHPIIGVVALGFSAAWVVSAFVLRKQPSKDSLDGMPTSA